MGVDEVGVDEMGSRRSVTLKLAFYWQICSEN